MACSRRFVRIEHGVALHAYPVGLLDGSKPGGDPGLAGGGYGLAVAAAVGALGKVLAAAFDLAYVGFAFVGVGGDGEQGDVRGGRLGPG